MELAVGRRAEESVVPSGNVDRPLSVISLRHSMSFANEPTLCLLELGLFVVSESLQMRAIYLSLLPHIWSLGLWS